MNLGVVIIGIIFMFSAFFLGLTNRKQGDERPISYNQKGRDKLDEFVNTLSQSMICTAKQEKAIEILSKKAELCYTEKHYKELVNQIAYFGIFINQL